MGGEQVSLFGVRPARARPEPRRVRAPRPLGAADRGALIERLNRDGSRLAAHFELTYRAILAERRGIHGHYGVCSEDGLIKIRLQHATRGTPLKYSSLVSTLCHELAHLSHFDHGPQFQRLYQQILRWARKSGIYRPRRSEDAETQQGDCRLDPEERAHLLEGMRRAVARSRATQLSLFAETS